MKKHCFIYLFFLCLIATSCDKTVFENENVETTAITRSGYDPNVFARYNTIFYNVKPIYGGEFGSDGLTSITGDVTTFENGVEYDLQLWCQTRGDVKCIVWVTGGAELFYNGRCYPSLYGESGKEKEFTVRFNNTKSTFHLALEGPYDPTSFKDGQGKLVIASTRYNGERMNGAGYVQGGYHDLTVNARWMDSHGSPTVGMHWKCTKCGTLNSTNTSTCLNCEQ